MGGLDYDYHLLGEHQVRLYCVHDCESFCEQSALGLLLTNMTVNLHVSFSYVVPRCIPLRFDEQFYRCKGRVTYVWDILATTRRQVCLPLVDTRSDTANFMGK